MSGRQRSDCNSVCLYRIGWIELHKEFWNLLRDPYIFKNGCLSDCVSSKTRRKYTQKATPVFVGLGLVQQCDIEHISFKTQEHAVQVVTEKVLGGFDFIGSEVGKHTHPTPKPGRPDKTQGEHLS